MGNSKFKQAFLSKKIRKLSEGKCRICGENEYGALALHRIVPGAEGGKYSVTNTVTVCASCHAKHHAGVIKILGWVDSTAGKLLHWIDESETERFN